MSIIEDKTLRCKACGGIEFVKIPNEINHYCCKYCGTINVFYNGDPSENIVTADTIWERANAELKSLRFEDALKDFDRVIDRAPTFSKAYFGKFLAVNHFIDKADVYNKTKLSEYLPLLGDDDNVPDVNASAKLIKKTYGTLLQIALDNQNDIDRDSYEALFTEAARKTIELFNERKYRHACSLALKNDTDSLLTCGQYFEDLGSYKDSEEKLRQLQPRINEAEYHLAIDIAKTTESRESIQFCIDTFNKLGNYKNSKFLAKKYANLLKKSDAKIRIQNICSKLAYITLITGTILFFFVMAQREEWFTTVNNDGIVKQFIDFEIPNEFLGLMFSFGVFPLGIVSAVFAGFSGKIFDLRNYGITSAASRGAVVLIVLIREMIMTVTGFSSFITSLFTIILGLILTALATVVYLPVYLLSMLLSKAVYGRVYINK